MIISAVTGCFHALSVQSVCVWMNKNFTLVECCDEADLTAR